MNNVSGHLAILAGAGVAAALLALATYVGRRMETSAQAPVVVTVPARATAAPPPQAAPRQAPPATASPRDPASLARQLQSELRRVGCYDGELSGVWTPRTRAAMKDFTDRVNASLPVDKPDQILLALVQGHQGVACVPAPVLAKAPAKPEPPPETDAAPKPPVPVPVIVPPIAAAAPKILAPPPNAPPPAAPQPSAARVDPTQAPPQAQSPASPAAPGERPPRSHRHGAPVPEVGVYERRPRRTARSYRQVRYARALLRSLKRAASMPWRLP
jgi:hypothetical protein